MYISHRTFPMEAKLHFHGLYGYNGYLPASKTGLSMITNMSAGLGPPGHKPSYEWKGSRKSPCMRGFLADQNQIHCIGLTFVLLSPISDG